LEQEVMIFEFC